MLISIVSPVYKAEAIVDELIDRITRSMDPITPDYEIILVDDGSPDASWAAIERRAAANPRLKGLKLSRNFGQHHAITAGLATATGEWVVVMDCDLQDQPEEIGKLFQKAQEGFSVVLASRTIRNDSFFKRQFSIAFYKVLGYLTDTRQSPEVANFGIYHRDAIKAVLSLDDYVKYFPTMIKWVGFKQTTIDVNHAERFAGESSYNFSRLIRLGLNVIVSFSDKPLMLTVKSGIAITLLSILFIAVNLYLYLNGKIVVLGYASIIFSIWFFFGVVITFIGILGIYIGRIFDQVKNRPVYIVEKRLNTPELPGS